MKFNHVCKLVLIFSFTHMLLLPSSSFATSWAYEFVVWKGYTYEVLDEVVTNVGRKIGKVTRYSDMESYSGNFSNAYKEGTKYYAIQGISTDEAIAVQVEDGVYKKAVRRGEHKGVSSPALLIVGAFVLLIIGAFYVEKKLKK
ncbi:hypothetical protein ACSVDA_13860 [Cytobacillus sp. Hm23]